MSATTIYEGLATVFANLPDIRNVILGEPTAIHELPAIYTAYAGFERVTASQQVMMTHTFTHRLIIRFQDQQEAEAQLLALLHQVPIAIDQDPKLGGIIDAGMARCTGGQAGFLSINATLYRIVDYTTSVLEKGPFPFPPSSYTGEL
jgi:hypothetical protein